MMTKTLNDDHRDENDGMSIEENVHDGIATEEIAKSNENDDVENGGDNPDEARQTRTPRMETRAPAMTVFTEAEEILKGAAVTATTVAVLAVNLVREAKVNPVLKWD
eukprot:jgi/Phyca11/17884/fgenesh1_pg.PHYCAscaffold_31_\